jgi:transcriptional regulator with XRE-family HTH domain
MRNSIQEVLNEKRITQLQLARETRIAPCDINQIVRGKKHCFAGWRRRIADALGVSEQDIFPDC